MKFEKIFRKPSRGSYVPAQQTVPPLPRRVVSRPCEVDGVPALFLRWIDADRVLIQIDALGEGEYMHRYRSECVLSPGCHGEVIRETFALVEYPDGTVGKVKPEALRFLDKEVEI